MTKNVRLRMVLMLCALVSSVFLCTACGSSGQGQSTGQNANQSATQTQEIDTSHFLVAPEEEPDTVDFQCTSIHYTVATNVFDRLVEMEGDENGGISIKPSLAEWWEESPDGTTYNFRLREGVKFSNGADLTSSDVLYSFKRLLTHPDSCNQDIAEIIKGASRLEKGETTELEGFKVIDDLNFSITLEEPFEAFLACLSMPGGSILDEQTTTEAGDRFGKDPAWTIGTSAYVFKEWEPGKGMKLVANPSCWSGAPANEGLDLRFVTEPEDIRAKFEKGELDILDLDDLGSSAEYFVHGDIYQSKLKDVYPIGITYVALNESAAPLNDERVRLALQLALDRDMLLSVVYSGRGQIENGIFSHGLYGFNPDLPAIPFDQERAKSLLQEAGYADGFDLTYSVKSSATQAEKTLADQIVSMWNQVGIRATVKVVGEDEFMSKRKSGELPCYAATWTADYNDPDNYIYTFFGNRENTAFRSLCYPREDVMERVRKARAITDPVKRIDEYHDLEKTIIQDDAAWIPLFSRTKQYVVSDRVENFQQAWNGSVKNVYRKMSIK